MDAPSGQSLVQYNGSEIAGCSVRLTQQVNPGEGSSVSSTHDRNVSKLIGATSPRSGDACSISGDLACEYSGSFSPPMRGRLPQRWGNPGTRWVSGSHGRFPRVKRSFALHVRRNALYVREELYSTTRACRPIRETRNGSER